MRIAHAQLKHGYNEYLDQQKNPEMNMDFGVQCMREGEALTCNADKECMYTLMQGKVVFEWDGHREEALRGSYFHEDPILLHVPQNTQVKISCLSEQAEVAINRTTNTRSFAPRLMRSEDLLSASEQRGAGLMNDTSTRIVRTYLDRSNCPESNFFAGEVVSFPGKWSSYPPHTHVEPEMYYYRFLPENGYGYAEVGDDNVYKVRNNHLTCMADGATHSQATAPGYAEWYLWVIRLRDDAPMETIEVPEHAWAGKPGAKYFPDI